MAMFSQRQNLVFGFPGGWSSKHRERGWSPHRPGRGGGVGTFLAEEVRPDEAEPQSFEAAEALQVGPTVTEMSTFV